MDEIMVSVICLTYNHEKYIRKCLDGFVMQKTSFRFEVLINDDASTDHTADIIREYEAKYPDIIKPVYQTENQYSKHVGIVKTFLVPKVRGKYVAFCEGDDYWSDRSKLQLQYEAMERNPDCSLCVHRVQGINEDGENIKNNLIPNNRIVILVEKMTHNDFFSIMVKGDGHPFQTSSHFVRASRYLDLINNPPEFKRASDVGDTPLLLYFGNIGSVYCLNDVMSCYRIGAIGSWSLRMASDREKNLAHIRAMISMYQLFNVYTNNVYEQYIEKLIESYSLHEKEYSLSSKDFLSYLIKNNGLKYPETHRLRFYTRLILDAYFPALLSLLVKVKRRVKQNGKSK